jgi:hypothetical protein
MKRNLSGFWPGFEIDVKCCYIARVIRLFFLELVRMGEVGTCTVWNLFTILRTDSCVEVVQECSNVYVIKRVF